MFESLNKMVEIKDNKLYTLDPFVYIDFVNENSLTEIAVQKIRNYTDLGVSILYINNDFRTVFFNSRLLEIS